ncbi:MAG TPA: hypothetical protein VGE13_01325 [Candidatus Saccharimonadales bacterium]
MSVELLLFFVAILLLGAIVLAFIARKGTSSQLNKDSYRSAWLKIEQEVDKDNVPSYQLAFLNADKLLDKALKARGIKGQTMGERMKAYNQQWSNANNIWSAHKIRNKLAHESGFQVDYDTTRRALAVYKQALKDVGAI